VGKLRQAAIWLTVAALAGCASVQPISDADRKKVSSVTINPNVSKPQEMSYLGPGGTAGLMFGIIGAVIAAPALEASRKSFHDYVIKNGISIERIVLEEVEAAMRRSGKFPLAAAPEAGGAVMHVSILQYGFSVPHGFSGKLVPTLFIRCELKDATGKVLWNASERVLPLGNPVEAAEPEAIRNDPKAMEASWRGAARHIAAEIVKSY